MRVSRIVQIEFASPQIRAKDSIQDIRKATAAAGLNLHLRYDVVLEMPMLTDDDRVTVEIKIPESEVEFFNIGNHLRGVSEYLTNMPNRKYKEYKVGNRLLTYTVINQEDISIKKIGLSERMEALRSFSMLLERDDELSNEYICRIMTLIEEAYERKKDGQ